MILNMEQQTAVENGEPVALNVAGTDCVLVRRDIYLRRDIETTNLLADEAEEMISQAESTNGTSEKAPQEAVADFDPEPPDWLDVEKDVYFPMTVPSYPLGKMKIKVEEGQPCIILPEALPDD